MDRVRQRAVAVAYRTETGVRDRLAALAARRGWTPAVLPYSGYAGHGRARILGRVVLAPSSVDPAAARGVPGWRRLLTLECPGVRAEVELAGRVVEVVSDEAGVVDARLPLDDTVPAGLARATIRVEGRGPVPAHVHVAAPAVHRGVVCDIDDTVWITGLAHPLQAARRTLMGTSSTRTSVPGMARLLREARGDDGAPVIYLSNGPWNLAGPVSRFLERHDFPAGALLMTDWGITPKRWFRDGREHKSSSLTGLVTDLPDVRWVLIGDDGEHDPDLYTTLATDRPDRVDAIVLREVPRSRTRPRGAARDRVGTVPVVRGADGDELRPGLSAARSEPGGSVGTQDPAHTSIHDRRADA